jgi:FG-GAP repeat.
MPENLYKLGLIQLILGITLLLPIEGYSQFPPVIDLAQTSADVTIFGAEESDHAGFRIAYGNINGDGFVDLLINSFNASPLGRQGVFEIDILWGGAVFDSTFDLHNPPSSISRVFGAPGDDGFFSSLACGDFNNDGFSDIIIGMPFYYLGGKAYLILGREVFPDTLDLESTTQGVITIYGIPYDEDGGFGRTSCCGNVNGDDYNDLIISTPYLSSSGGEVYVIYGRDSFPETIYTGEYIANATRIIDPEYYQGNGIGLFSDDIDGDGCDDILIGSPGGAIGYEAGKATLLYGSPVFPDTIILSDENLRMKRIYPEYGFGYLGEHVSICDVNQDHYKDLIISSPSASPFGDPDAGEIYIIYGGQVLPDSIHLSTQDISITRLIGACSKWSLSI